MTKPAFRNLLLLTALAVAFAATLVLGGDKSYTVACQPSTGTGSTIVVTTSGIVDFVWIRVDGDSFYFEKNGEADNGSAVAPAGTWLTWNWPNICPQTVGVISSTTNSLTTTVFWGQR